jgi:alkyl hydroperoxide reductase subunit AhpF
MQAKQIVDPVLIRDALHTLTAPVHLHYYTSDIASWYSYAERQLLEDIARFSEHITLHVHADRWDAQREATVGIARTPAIAVYGTQDTGIRYYGTPDGYELETFLTLLREVATNTPTLRTETVAALDHLTQRIHLEVLVSPT